MSIDKSPAQVTGGTRVPGYVVVVVSSLLMAALLLLSSILGSFAGFDAWWTTAGLFFLRSYGLFSLYIPAICIISGALLVQQKKKPAALFVLASSIVPFLTIAVAYSLLSGDSGVFEENTFFSFLGPRGFKLFMTVLVVLQIAIIVALSSVLFDRTAGEKDENERLWQIVDTAKHRKGSPAVESPGANAETEYASGSGSSAVPNPDAVYTLADASLDTRSATSGLASLANTMTAVPPLASLGRGGDFYSVDGRLEELDSVEDESDGRNNESMSSKKADSNSDSSENFPAKSEDERNKTFIDDTEGFSEIEIDDLDSIDFEASNFDNGKKDEEPAAFEEHERLETLAFDKEALEAPIEFDDEKEESAQLLVDDVSDSEDPDELLDPYEDIDVPGSDEVVDVSRFIGRDGAKDEVLTVDEFLAEDLLEEDTDSELTEPPEAEVCEVQTALANTIGDDIFDDDDERDDDEELVTDDLDAVDDLSRALTEAEERAREKSRALVEAKTREGEHTIVKKHQNWDLPIEELLTAYPDGEYWVIDQATKDAAVILKETLEEFKIRAEVTGIRKGPVITMFEILPAPGVKLSKIVNLQDNIALRLAASSVRIVAPIPGKHAVGIEVPNRKRNIVSFREMIEGELAREGKKHEIPVILGKDITGEAQTLDLVQTPHLLIAGSTGSGKSVCVNSMILSILYQRSPAECRLILIDPKIVELKLYNDIPHLLTPVITEPKRAFQALQYCIYEMERRYALLDSMGVRDIRSYNRRIKERGIATEHLPYIVVVIDEFADLMATTGKELESTVARLAAMSRAVGIHLVLATQRPSIDVITGLIKANIPSRIAFMVASKMDSRIIIDMVGAEKLLGKGDMLFASAWDPFPVRMQGAFVSEEEVERVVEHVKTLGAPDYIDEEIFYDDDEAESEPGMFSEGDDPLYEKALEIVMQQGKASASYIQRRLKIGYNRAARLVELMEDKGIVGPTQGSKPRELLRGN